MEQGRAAPRAQRHRLTDHAGRHLSAAREMLQERICRRCPASISTNSARSMCSTKTHDARRDRLPIAAHAALPRLHPRVGRAAPHAACSRSMRIAARRAQPGRSRTAGRRCCASTACPTGSAAAPQHTGSETMYDEIQLSGAATMRTPVIVRTRHRQRRQSSPKRKLVIFGANDLSDEADVTRARPARLRKSKTAAFVSDFRDLTVGDYVVHVEHGIARYHGPEGDRAGRRCTSNS